MPDQVDPVDPVPPPAPENPAPPEVPAPPSPYELRSGYPYLDRLGEAWLQSIEHVEPPTFDVDSPTFDVDSGDPSSEPGDYNMGHSFGWQPEGAPPPAEPAPSLHYDFSPTPLQPVQMTGPNPDPTYGGQFQVAAPTASSGGPNEAATFADFFVGRNGCLTAIADFFTGRIGCLALAGVVAAGGIGLYVAAPHLFGLGPSSQPETSIAGGTVASSPASASGCTGPALLIEDQFKDDLVLGGNPTKPSTFSTGGKKYCLTHLATYHWNGGRGDPEVTTPNPSPMPAGGTLWLSVGKKVFGGGPWFATATPGTGGALVNWEVDIPISSPVILDGTYTVGDSRPATWSWSKKSNLTGFFRVWAIEYTGP